MQRPRNYSYWPHSAATRETTASVPLEPLRVHGEEDEERATATRGLANFRPWYVDESNVVANAGFVDVFNDLILRLIPRMALGLYLLFRLDIKLFIKWFQVIFGDMFHFW